MYIYIYASINLVRFTVTKIQVPPNNSTFSADLQALDITCQALYPARPMVHESTNTLNRYIHMYTYMLD